MARPYAEEMARLGETFAWVSEGVNLKPLCQAVRTAGNLPLRAIGSGGSLTGAHGLAALHQRYTGHLATVATPLEAIGEPLGANSVAWLLSAGGGNVDVVAAAKALIRRETRQIGVLCGRDASALADLCREHPYVDLLIYPPPAGKDGFLATNSLFGFTALLTRAYSTEFDSGADWQDTVNRLEPLLPVTAAASQAWTQETAHLWTRPTTLVLHGPSTRVGAIDLESKFTESALGQIQLADYRNFAHGRHHWLAKRSETSAVLAFITNADRVLAERTLDLLPVDVPQARIAFDGSANAVMLASLLAALKITGWAGISRGIDPGRPGVPKFGRKLYHLPLPRAQRVAGLPRLTPRGIAAIARKTGVNPHILAASGELGHWREALASFRSGLRRARFAGIVLDYDGTVVDTRRRFDPPELEMASELARLVEEGARVAVATGRGKSVRHDLQSCVARSLWPLVLVGYYNGGEVASLDNDGAPDGSAMARGTLRSLSEAFRSHPGLSTSVRQEDRPFQITLQSNGGISVGRLWDLVHHVIHLTGVTDVGVTRSGHSVDIVATGVSKLNVVQRLRETIGEAPILVIGDRGRWPGNDHELLSERFALGVDEISVDPATCWHLGEPGQRGPAVTLEYLTALEVHDGRLKFKAGSLQ